MSDASSGIPGVTGAIEIGRGGFGVVYRATESDLGRDVAVKVLSGQLDDRSQVRFERERKAMGVLSGHPNIVTIFRSGMTDQGALYLVMEYLPGGSLAERLEADGALGVADTARIGVELSGALETAHRAGVLHRDIKPGNVMMDSLGRAKLGDFGIARLDGSPETKSAVITASVAHAPPEVISGQKPDERSDVYSLGSMLYELASGTPAFFRDTDESMIPMFARIATEPAPDLRHTGLPDVFAATIERAMSKQPGERFDSAAELGRALTDAQRALGHTETPLWLEGEPLSDRLATSATQTVSPPASDDLVPRSAAPRDQHTSTVQAPNSVQPPPHEGQRLQSSHPVPGQNQFADASQTPAAKKSNARLVVASIIGVLLLVVGVVSIARLAGNDDGPALEGLTGAGSTTAPTAAGPTTAAAPTTAAPTTAAPTTAAPTTAAPTTAAPTTAAPTTTTSTTAGPPLPPARADYLADLPALPSNEQPYTAYRTVGDAGGAFTVRTPVEWGEVLSTAGQVITSADNAAALRDEPVSGLLVSGSGLVFWDADLFLDELLRSFEDPASPCVQVKREPFVDGEFDGLIYAELCQGGATLVVDVLVATADRQTVILVAMQMTDERDMAAFQEALASFILFNPADLPAA